MSRFALLVVLLAFGCTSPPPPGPDGGGRDGAIAVMDGAVVDGSAVGCSSAAECDDGIDCTVDRCDLGRCVHPVVAARCTAGAYCDPRRGCVMGRACGGDSDCADMDPCTRMERCDAASRTCRSEPLDGDMDGYPPLVCGGSDCDDADPLVHPAASERCNVRDDNCDGRVDDGVQTCGSSCLPETGNGGCGLGCDRAVLCYDFLGYRSSINVPNGADCVAGACRCAAGSGARCDTTIEYLGSSQSGDLRITGVTACNVDFMTNPFFCGNCTTNCTRMFGRDGVCEAGMCRCPADRPTLCGTAMSPICVNTQNDTRNCGRCGNACGAGQHCVAGMCSDCMTAGEIYCPGPGCVNPQTNPFNCGRCGAVCPSGVSCVSGRCACPAGTELCGGTCISVSDDPMNCGGCGRRCGCGEGCAAGACTPSPSCSGGTTICGGATVCPFNSNQHCGRCGNACGVGQSCCRGTCV